MSHTVILSPEAIRVLGVLLEKEKATPEYYPMTPNSIINACNQKSSRNPVVQYDEETVLSAIEELKRNGLCNTVTGGGSRTLKYKHNASIAFDLNDREEATLCLLLLRGPLTPGEIKSNAGRLFAFANLDSVIESLNCLMQQESPLASQLARQPGQKEARFAHLLGGEIHDDLSANSSELATMAQPLSQRVSALEVEIALLRKQVDDLLRLLE